MWAALLGEEQSIDTSAFLFFFFFLLFLIFTFLLRQFKWKRISVPQLKLYGLESCTAYIFPGAFKSHLPSAYQ